VTKKWGEKARNNFSRNTQMVQAKMLRKNTTQKIEKKRFLYSHEYRDKKMGGKKRAKEFLPETHE